MANENLEIIVSDDLKIGSHYHFFERKTGKHKINMICHSEMRRYVDVDGSLFGRVSVNDALKKWRIFKIPTPDL